MTLDKAIERIEEWRELTEQERRAETDFNCKNLFAEREVALQEVLLLLDKVKF